MGEIAQRLVGISMEFVYASQIQNARNVIKGLNHPAHCRAQTEHRPTDLFYSYQGRYTAITTNTDRLKNSYFPLLPPSTYRIGVIRTLNTGLSRLEHKRRR